MKRLYNTILILIRRHWFTLLIILIYAFISFLTIHKVIFDGNTFVGMRHDWYSAPYPQMIIDHIKSVFYIWNDYFGYPYLRNNVLYYYLFEGLLGLVTRFNGIVLFKVEIAVLIFMSGIFMYYMLRTIGVSRLSAFTSGLLYMLTPVIFNKIVAGHLGYVFSYSLTPLIFALFLKGVKNDEVEIRYIILAGIVYGVSVAQHQFFVYIPIIIALYILLLWIIEYRAFIKGIESLLIILLIGFLMHMFWILPNATLGSIPVYYLSPLDYHGIMASPNVIESMLMIGYPHPYDYKALLSKGLMPRIYIILLAFPSISMISLLRKDKRVYKLLAASLLLIGVFLTAAMKSPFGSLWQFLFIHVPGFRIFRETYHSEFLVAFSISLLFGFFIGDISDIFKTTKKLSTIVFLLFTMLVLAIGFPVISGDFLGQLGTYTFPYEEYKSIYQGIRTDPEIYRVLFLPSIGPFKYSGITSHSSFQGWDPILQSPPKPTFSFVTDRTKSLNRFHEYFIYRVRQGEDIRNYLYVTSVRYIVIRPFCKSWYLYYVPSSPRQKRLWKNFNFTNYFGHIATNTIYKNYFILIPFNSSRYVRVSQPYCAIGDLGTIGKLPPEALKNLSLIYCSSSTLGFVNISKLIIIDNPDWIKELAITYLLSDSEAKSLVLRAEFADPDVGWSYDTLSWWENQKVAALTLHYGMNTILTSAKDVQIKTMFTVNKANLYILCIRYLSSINGGAIKLFIDNNSVVIKTKSELNNFHWKCLGPFNLRKGKHSIILINEKGFNAISAIVLVPEKDYYEAIKKVSSILKNKILVYVFGATDFYRNNAGVHELNNTKVIIFQDKGEVWQYIRIIKNGTYRVALKGVGSFKIRIGNYTFIMNTNPELSEFSYSPSFNLTEGKYLIEIRPLNTENIVKNPSFEKASHGLPKGWRIFNTKDFIVNLGRGYQGKYSLKVVTNATKRTWSWIRSEPIDVQPGKIYLVVTHMKIYNTNTSHIVIEGYFSSENAWRQIIQIPPGFNGTGTYDWKTFSTYVKIPESVTKIRIALNAGWVLNRNKGSAITWFDDIEVVPLDKASKLSAVWLYSSREETTVHQLFKTEREKARILSYAKIDPTAWKVKVIAGGPFMLTFAEGYDPLWEARIYVNGKLMEVTKAVPVFGAINGFWINTSGNLTIIIRYSPQDLFELGFKISIVTLSLVALYPLLGRYWSSKVANKGEKHG